MGQQGTSVQINEGVNFDNIKVGNCAAVFLVSNQGKPVNGTNLEFGDHSTFGGGQMSDESLESIPKARSTEASSDSLNGKSTKDTGSTKSKGGRILGVTTMSNVGTNC